MGRILIASFLVFVAAFAGASSELQEDNRSNIVFILADDMRADDLEHMPQTRQLLADQGLTFSNAFVTHPLCCPSRATILRGQYTHNHQVLTNKASDGGFERFRSIGYEDSTIATWLQNAGYQTVLLGKYLNGYGSRDYRTYVPPGWDEWYGKIEGADYYDYEINENGTLVAYGDAEEDYFTDVLGQKAKAYVQRAAESPAPFFMYVAPATPHGPFIPAPRHQETFPDAQVPRSPSFNEADVSDKPAWLQGTDAMSSGTIAQIDNAYRNRLQMLLSLDDMVAGLLEELETTGELDNTYVFFTSDNGYHLGEHRIGLGKRTPYEEAIRVPLLVRGPEVPAGQVIEQMSLNIDFAPTLAELTGAFAPAFVDGRSLVRLLRGTSPATWRSIFLIEHWNGGGGQPQSTPSYTGVRTSVYKYVRYAPGDEEFYDLSSDPYELESTLTSADPALIESLKSRLEALTACAGESCRTAEENEP